MQILDLPDGHLAYRDEGTGRPLVLLHGGGLDHRMWEQQIAPLARDHRVIAPDARGHGRSATPAAPFRHCDDILALLTHLDTGPATLVGLSMGGATAVDTALEHPRLVHALVVSGVGTGEPTFTDPWTLDVLAALQRAAEARDVDGWIEAFLRFVAGPRRRLADVDPDVVARCREMVTHTVATHVRPDGQIPLLPVERTWERLPGITAPVLTICGALDSPDHLGMAERLAREVPDGRSVTVPGAAHYPNMEQPQAFEAALRGALVSSAGRT